MSEEPIEECGKITYHDAVIDIVKKCTSCGRFLEGYDTKPDGDGGEICYPCHVSGISFGRIPQGTGVTDSVRSEIDLHKRLADEAGHEWTPVG